MAQEGPGRRQAGWLNLRHLAPEEECFSVGTLFQPIHQLLLGPLLDTIFPNRAQALAVYSGPLGSSSVGRTPVSFCTNRSAG